MVSVKPRLWTLDWTDGLNLTPASENLHMQIDSVVDIIHVVSQHQHATVVTLDCIKVSRLQCSRCSDFFPN